MGPDLSNPSMISFFGAFSMGAMVARCLIATFATMAFTFSVYQIRRVWEELRLMDEAMRLCRAQDAAGHQKAGVDQKRDVWTS
jgi:hypothetical protein